MLVRLKRWFKNLRLKQRSNLFDNKQELVDQISTQLRTQEHDLIRRVARNERWKATKVLLTGVAKDQALEYLNNVGSRIDPYSYRTDINGYTCKFKGVMLVGAEETKDTLYAMVLIDNVVELGY
jgi:hypothetical protein